MSGLIRTMQDVQHQLAALTHKTPEELCADFSYADLIKLQKWAAALQNTATQVNFAAIDAIHLARRLRNEAQVAFETPVHVEENP